MFEVLEAVLACFLALVTVGSLHREEDHVAGQHHAVTGPVGLAAVLLGLDKVGVGGLGGDEGRGEVPGSLRGGVPDVQLQAVLLLRRAARAVKFQ